MLNITIESILFIHDRIMHNDCNDIKDENLLYSIAMGPYQSFSGQDLYPSDLDKISYVFYSIIKNHCFYDGNKRTAVLTLISLLESIGKKITLTEAQLYDLSMDVANGVISKNELTDILDKYIQ